MCLKLQLTFFFAVLLYGRNMEIIDIIDIFKQKKLKMSYIQLSVFRYHRCFKPVPLSYSWSLYRFKMIARLFYCHSTVNNDSPDNAWQLEAGRKCGSPNATLRHTHTKTLTRSCCSSSDTFLETTVREVRWGGSGRVVSCAAVLSTPLSLSLLLHRWSVWLLHLLHPAVRSVFCSGRTPPPRPRTGGDSCKRVSDVDVVVVVTRRGGGGGCLVAKGSTCMLRACHRLPLQLTAKPH